MENVDEWKNGEGRINNLSKQVNVRTSENPFSATEGACLCIPSYAMPCFSHELAGTEKIRNEKRSGCFRVKLTGILLTACTPAGGGLQASQRQLRV